MRQAGTRRRIARALERAREQAASAPTRAARMRAARRRTRGQTLIIFVLLFTALLGFMGLAIDTARVYDLYARMQRAAESGALAGVIYMPNNYLNVIPVSPNDNAICRALREAAKNGFGSGCNPSSPPAGLSGLCPTTPSSVEIAVCPVQTDIHELRVFVTERIDVAFLSTLGIGPLTITAQATAQYLPPVDVAVDPGAPGGTGSWGTFGECNGASAACLGAGVRNWSGNINGPGELKEEGDPLVTCEEGPTGPPNIDQPVTKTNPATTPTYVGMPTNHPQYLPAIPGTVPANCANTDQANAFTGPIYYNPGGGTAPTRAGYAFFVHVPAGDSEDLWVWNAPFSPNSKNVCNGRTGGQGQSSYDTFYYFNCQGSNSSAYPNYPYAPTCDLTPYTCATPGDSANLFFSVTYSVYAIPNSSAPAGQLRAAFTAMPYEVGDHGCAFWQPDSNAAPYAGIPSGCKTSDCVAQWCPVNNQLGDNGSLWTAYPLTGALSTGPNDPGGSDYRVMVVSSDYGQPTNYNAGYGGHSYSLKLCPTGTTQGNVQTCNPTAGSVVAGWSYADVLFVFPGNGTGGPQTTEYPLGFVGPEFAGRTLDIRLFDEGDLQGTNNSLKGQTIYAVAPPTAASDPCTVTSAQLSASGYNASSFLFPSGERNASFSSALPGIQGSNQGDIIYNGLWVDEQVAVPSANLYSNGGEWTLCATAPQTNDADVLGISFNAIGESPVHLV